MKLATRISKVSYFILYHGIQHDTYTISQKYPTATSGFLFPLAGRWTVERKVGRCPSADRILGRESPETGVEVDTLGIEMLDIVMAIFHGKSHECPDMSLKSSQ